MEKMTTSQFERRMKESAGPELDPYGKVVDFKLRLTSYNSGNSPKAGEFTDVIMTKESGLTHVDLEMNYAQAKTLRDKLDKHLRRRPLFDRIAEAFGYKP